jgi:hypothetical protein
MTAHSPAAAFRTDGREPMPVGDTPGEAAFEIAASNPFGELFAYQRDVWERWIT